MATPPPVAPGGWRRSLFAALGALGVATLMLALVVRSPHSEPLLLGVGVSGILILRLARGRAGVGIADLHRGAANAGPDPDRMMR